MFRKRVTIIVATVLVVVLAVFCLAACNNTSLEEQIRDLQNQVNGFESDFSEKDVTVYIGDEKFEIVTRKTFLHDVLKDMYSQDLISAYEYSGGNLSPFVTQVGDLQQNFAEYKYYTVWHSIDVFSLKGVYSNDYGMPGRGVQKVEGEEPYQTVFVVTEYKGTVLFYSNVGVGLLPIVDGGVYAILID